MKRSLRNQPLITFLIIAALLHATLYILWPGDEPWIRNLTMPSRAIQLVNLNVAKPIKVQKTKKLKLDNRNKQQDKILKMKRMGRGNNVMPVFTADTMPQPLVDIAGLLRHPAGALKAGVGGTVVLELDIDASGYVVNIRIKQKAGWGFDEEAVRVMRKVHFMPAMRDKKPVAVTVILPIVFQK
ncbi:MAG: energy transducer TonB [Spirochaetes bacterium]|nr:energy transducer TonB [Spirochaetota bacterium]